MLWHYANMIAMVKRIDELSDNSIDFLVGYSGFHVI